MPLSPADALEKIDHIAGTAVRDHDANKINYNKFKQGMDKLVQKQNELKAWQKRLFNAGIVDGEGKFLESQDDLTEDQQALLDEYEGFLKSADLDQEASAGAGDKFSPKSISDAISNIFNVGLSENQKLSEEQVNKGKQALAAAQAQQTATSQAATQQTPTTVSDRQMTPDQQKAVLTQAEKVGKVAELSVHMVAGLLDTVVTVGTVGIIKGPFLELASNMTNQLKGVISLGKTLYDVCSSQDSSQAEKTTAAQEYQEQATESIQKLDDIGTQLDGLREQLGADQSGLAEQFDQLRESVTEVQTGLQAASSPSPTPTRSAASQQQQDADHSSTAATAPGSRR